LSVPFNRKDGYSPKLPEMLAINPKGQVPVLIDGDLSVYDSTVIFEYLEDRYPQPPLYPADPCERARCRQAEAASDEILFPHVWTLIREVFYKPSEAGRDQAAIDAARAAIAEVYGGLDAKLAGREHFCGSFSVADIAYFLTIAFATSLAAAPPPSLSNLGGWLRRVAARPSIAAEMAGMTAAMARL
jgi:glutathione S-transferase